MGAGLTMVETKTVVAGLTPLAPPVARSLRSYFHALSKYQALPTYPSVDPRHLTVVHQPLPAKDGIRQLGGLDRLHIR